MTGQELIDKGIAEGNMELVRQGRELLFGQAPDSLAKEEKAVKGKRGRPKGSKNKVSPKTTVSSASETAPKSETPKFSSEHEYIEWIFQKQQDLINDIIAGKPVPQHGVPQICVDDASIVCQAEIQVTKQLEKAQKKRAPKRSQVHYVTRPCPRCNQPTQVRADEVNIYNWNTQNVDSDKPTFACNGCGGSGI